MMSHHTLPLIEEEVMEHEAHAGFGTLRTPNGNLPLEAISVYTRIVGMLAETTLQQVFKNTLNQPLEATYIFPLPPSAALTSFTMRVGERLVEGVLEERQRAREQYAQAIQQGYRATITEQERPNVFTLQVGNLMPGEEAQITFRMAMPLQLDMGEVTYRFPLVVAPRYIPGIPLVDESVGDGVVPDTDQVPDASRITPPVLLPGFPNPVKLSLEVEIDACGLRLYDMCASLHTVVTKQQGDTWHVRLQPGERLNRDFILRYRLSDEDWNIGALASPGGDVEEEGTLFCLLTAPKQDTRSQLPRDVVFVLDRSGSMEGWKMVAARRVVGRVLDTLTAQDRFTVVAFDDMIETLDPHLQVADNRGRYRAMEWLAGIDARGGTEVMSALHQAASILNSARADALEAIFLVTDGQVGNEDAVIRQMKQAGITLFVVGVDTVPNDALLSRLARETGGVCEFIENEARLDEVLQRLAERLGKPVLQDVEVALHSPTGKAQLIPDTLLPSQHRVVYSGGSLLLLARCRHLEEAERLTITASLPDGETWNQTVPLRVQAHPALRPIWARDMIQELETRYVAERNAELEPEILSLSLQHGVLSRFTAYILVDRSEVVNAGGEVRRIVQPVDVPGGWEMYDADVGFYAEPIVLQRFVDYSPLDDVADDFYGPVHATLLPAELIHSSGSRTPSRKPKLRRWVSETLQQIEQLDRSDNQAVRHWLAQLLIALRELRAVLQPIPTASDIAAKIDQLFVEVEDYLRGLPDFHQLDTLLKQCRDVLTELSKHPALAKRTRWW
jgi:Ca-activated chloride channel family protein